MKIFISYKLFFYLIIFPLVFNTPTLAQNPKQSLINVSKITSWVTEEGFHNWIISDNSFNGSYPNGLPIGVIFSEGICWGGLVYDGQNQKVRVNGNTFGTGCSPITRLFRVRTDYYKVDLINDAASFFNKNKNEVTEEEINQIYNQYEKDWNEWPADKGAPYYDIDKDGKYNPDIDVPGVPGALQTLWICYNDDISELNYGSIPIGLEVQETHWAYTNLDPLGNVIYRKIDLIYKGTSNSLPNSQIDSMYICQWSDIDLGTPNDDFIGCDTMLNLGYVYNSKDPDTKYEKFGLVPPAVGYSILQGVSNYTSNYSDSAIFNFRWKRGYKYFNSKPLYVAILTRTGGCFADPQYNYNGTLEFYNLMSGYLPVPRYPDRRLGCEFIGYGTYMLPGDPVIGTGQIDGITDGPGDRRMWLMNGPFSMNLGDTAEVVIPLIAGMGDNHLASITELRNNTSAANTFYNYFVEEMTAGTIQVAPPDRMSPILPTEYILYQNYPNPFNSYTRFNFEQPKDAHVSLIVYNMLGEKIAVVIDEFLLAGSHKVTSDFKGLASGVYLARIKFENEDSNKATDKLTKSLKLILLK